MKAHIIDGHALLAIPELVDPEKLGEVFETMNAMVIDDQSLNIVRPVIEVVRRRHDKNSPLCIWANTISAGRHTTPVDYDWQLKAQAAAQKAGYDGGLEDTLASHRTGAIEIVGLALFRWENGLDVEVVTEDWTDKPTRPALGPACHRLGVPACRLPDLFTSYGLDHCIRP